MRLRSYLFGCCVALFGVTAQAETVGGLYQVREPVSGQGAEARAQATQAALDTLVLRLTGDPKAPQNPGLAELRKDPQQIISQFGTEAGPPEVLLVEFDPGSTERALRKAGLALWGSNRPAILGWWLSDSTEGSSLVGDGQSAAEPLRRAAQHRGLPLRLPLGDLEEQLVATAKNLEGTDPAPLQAASGRYGADALLAVHATEADGKWNGTWRLWLGEQREQGKVEGADQAALADAVMLAVSQRLAPRFVARPGASSEQSLQVQGVNLERYAELSRVLEPFGGRIVEVQGDVMTWKATASPDQLRAQLGLARLQELPPEAAPAAPVANPAPPAEDAAPAPAATPFTGMRFHW